MTDRRARAKHFNVQCAGERHCDLENAVKTYLRQKMHNNHATIINSVTSYQQDAADATELRSINLS